MSIEKRIGMSTSTFKSFWITKPFSNILLNAFEKFSKSKASTVQWNLKDAESRSQKSVENNRKPHQSTSRATVIIPPKPKSFSNSDVSICFGENHIKTESEYR